MQIGDSFHLPEEGVHGVIVELYYDDAMQPVSAVVELADGGYAAVDLAHVEPVTVH
ncbi:hypothetical protein [Bordetella petrii]|uniref:hypothetical protein n=1 Tax=Bordetella petrii TaxID=94624 RepID=UPI0004BC3DD0|nr:hypothetical protein [Bordetella petrii]